MRETTIITENDPVKVAIAESALTTMEDINIIDKWRKVRKIKRVFWNFTTEEDARYIASYFMNRIRFEYVQRL